MDKRNDIALPAAIEAERVILGAILLDAAVCNEASTLLGAEDFHLDSHRRIFKAMLELNRDNRAIDMVTVADHIENVKELGGVPYIASLIDGVPHQPSIAEYARIVTEKARLRGLINAAAMAQSKALDGDDSHEVIAELSAKISSLLEHRTRVRPIAEVGISFLKNLHKIRSLQRDTIGLTYGLAQLDHMTTGIREADYTIIAARPGNGKSALVRQIAVANARAGVKVIVFTPEVTDEQFFSLLVPHEANVQFFKVRNPREMNVTEVYNTEQAVDGIINWPLVIDDTSGIDISELIAKARMHIAKGAQLIIVDYLQLVKSKAKDARERIDQVSAGLRDLAKSSGVPVIAVSQLSRPEGRNLNERPTIFHLKESGNLEQDAFNVLLLYRPVVEGEYTGQDEIIIGKQRFGDANTFVPVTFNKRSISYSERNFA